MPADGVLPQRTRIAAYAVCLHVDAVLLTRLTSDGRTWTLPGGGVDFGEHPADAARREVLEETGLHVELDAMLGVDSVVIRDHRPPDHPVSDWHGIRLVWRAHVVGGRLRDEVGGSTDHAAWVPLAEVPELPTVELVDVALAWLD